LGGGEHVKLGEVWEAPSSLPGSMTPHGFLSQVLDTRSYCSSISHICENHVLNGNQAKNGQQMRTNIEFQVQEDI
jgi:hypothetical protein